MSDEPAPIVEVERMPIASAAPEVDVQIATAKRYPRSIKKVLVEAESMATIDDDTAASMSYAVPRGGKTIEGASVRLAEVMVSAWGNLRAEANILEADATEVTGEAMCWDLEKNVAVKWRIKRRITDKYGKRYNDDMIVVTGNAAAAIAFRNAVFKVIPKSYVDRIQEKARAVAIGDAKNFGLVRQKWVNAFARHGIPEERVLGRLGKASIEDVTTDDVATLRGFYTAIKEEGMDVQEIFPPVESAADKAAQAVAKKQIAGARSTKPSVAAKVAAGTKVKEAQATEPPAEEAPPGAMTLEDDVVDTETGEILSEAPESEPEPFPDNPPAAEKPKATKKARGTQQSDADIRAEREDVIATYIDVCESKGKPRQNVTRMSTPAIKTEIRTMIAEEE